MSETRTAQRRDWKMPIVLERYDRSPLTAHEKEMMAPAARLRGNARGVNGLNYAKRELARFQEPIFDVMALRTHAEYRHRSIRKVLYREMIQRNASFWQWSKEDWVDILCPTYQDYDWRLHLCEWIKTSC